MITNISSLKNKRAVTHAVLCHIKLNQEHLRWDDGSWYYKGLQFYKVRPNDFVFIPVIFCAAVGFVMFLLTTEKYGFSWLSVIGILIAVTPTLIAHSYKVFPRYQFRWQQDDYTFTFKESKFFRTKTKEFMENELTSSQRSLLDHIGANRR